MPRLYLRFYFALLGSLIAFALTTGLLWHRVGGPVEHAGETLGILINNALPPAGAPIADQQAALQKLVGGLDADVALLGDDRATIATVGRSMPLPQAGANPTHRAHLSKDDAVWSLHLPDGRWLVASVPIGFGHPAYALLLTLTMLALAVGVGAYPIVRRLTKRLERLQLGVESLGAGELSARVAVEGGDEIARLAESFNRAAGRIEDLVGAHKTLLANASHELRTPLTRIRMALELMNGSADAGRMAGLDRDICELDLLIDEILLASRLDAVAQLEVDEEVDLLALAAEECARYHDAQLDGSPVIVRGDSRLLRRLLRNLLENAQRHGEPPARVRLTHDQSGVEIVVCDNGPGIPADQRERVFEPFYRRPRSSENAGAGLGLALVRQIARRHGGEARCVPMGANRTSFIVTLPGRARSLTTQQS